MRAIRAIPNLAQRSFINSKHVRKSLTISVLVNEGAITLSQYFRHHVEDEDDETWRFLGMFYSVIGEQRGCAATGIHTLKKGDGEKVVEFNSPIKTQQNGDACHEDFRADDINYLK